MNVLETIREKVFHLPPKAQEEVLREVERIEERYNEGENHSTPNGDGVRKTYGLWNGKEITKEEYLQLDHNERIDFDLGNEYDDDHEDKD